MGVRDIIIEKFTSGRWFMSVAFTTTYCVCLLGICYMAIKKSISTETFMAVWAGFVTMVVLINEWYFKREDRTK